jgi:hypothetical protein
MDFPLPIPAYYRARGNLNWEDDAGMSFRDTKNHGLCRGPRDNRPIGGSPGRRRPALAPLGVGCNEMRALSSRHEVCPGKPASAPSPGVRLGGGPCAIKVRGLFRRGCGRLDISAGAYGRMSSWLLPDRVKASWAQYALRERASYPLG